MPDTPMQNIHLPLHTSAVLFDLDDTLHHRNKAFRGWAEAFAHTHLTDADNTAIAAMVEYLVELDNYGYTPRDTYFTQLHEHYPSLSTRLTPLEQMITQYHLQVVQHLVREDSIYRLLQALKDAHIPCGFITNGSAQQQKRKIDMLGFGQFTHCIFISEAFGAKKPDPTIFLAAARCLGVQPAHILFVGDHPRFDIWGAKQVGMKTAWVHHATRTWPADMPSTVADITINGIEEIATLFGLAHTYSPPPISTIF